MVVRSGLTEDGYIPVDPATLATRFAGVYAIGDVATQGTPKAGVFAEGAARALATSLIAPLRGSGPAGVHTGTGSCYIEFGADRIGRVDIDFLSGRHRPGSTGRRRSHCAPTSRSSARAVAPAGSPVRADPSYSAGASSSTSAMMAAAASAETTCFAILL